MTKLFTFYLCSTLLVTCQSNNEGQNPKKALQLFSQGKKILKNRNAIDYKDSAKATELNKKAIEKFAAAYEADTTFVEAALYASECTMYGQDYEACINWTSKLMKLNSPRWSGKFCEDRIQYCKRKLQTSENK